LDALIWQTVLSSLQHKNDSESAAATQLIASACGDKKLGGTAEAADANPGDVSDLSKQEARRLPIANPDSKWVDVPLDILSFCPPAFAPHSCLETLSIYMLRMMAAAPPLIYSLICAGLVGVSVKIHPLVLALRDVSLSMLFVKKEIGKDTVFQYHSTPNFSVELPPLRNSKTRFSEVRACARTSDFW